MHVFQQVVRNGDRVGVEWNRDRTVGDEGDTLDDDDSAGWITPENFEQACEEMGGVLEEKANGIAVGCATTDFAMQVSEGEKWERRGERNKRERERLMYLVNCIRLRNSVLLMLCMDQLILLVLCCMTIPHCFVNRQEYININIMYNLLLCFV